MNFAPKGMENPMRLLNHKLSHKIITILLLAFATVPAAQADTTGSAQGYVFHDANSNGADDTEMRLPGFTIVLKNLTGATIRMADLSNVDGSFLFKDLPFQKYLLCEVFPADSKWITTTAQCQEIEISEMNAAVIIAIGNRPRLDSDIGCVRSFANWTGTPQGQLLFRFLVQDPTTITLGTAKYNSPQLISLLSMPPADNALLTLGHQLIIAKTNIMATASGTPIASSIASADTALADLSMPLGNSNFIDAKTPEGKKMLKLANELNRYNDGKAGVPICN